MEDSFDDVKQWYDGFCFGKQRDIYNPWLITKYLDTKELKSYWANTSSNQLIAKGIRKEKIRHYGFAFCGKKVLIGK